MSRLTARFAQSPNEIRRGKLDYTAQLSTGEIITGVTVNVLPIGSPPISPAFAITGVAIGPAPASIAVFYSSGGVDGNSYEAQFLTTTSLGQTFEDVVQFDIRSKS